MLKHTLLAAVAVLSLSTAAQAQTYSLSSYYYYYPIVQTDPIQFDSSTGVMTIEGTKGNDDCYISISSSGMQVNLYSGKQTYSEFFGPYDVKKIVFNGGLGDDSFQFSNSYYMNYLKTYYGMFDLVCDLNGGDGTDYLSGGPGADILDGGADGCLDVLIGNEGGDVFLRTRTWSYLSGWGWYYSYELESIQDFDYKEGDLIMFTDQLDDQAEESETQSSTSTTSTTSTTSLTLSTNLLSY